MAAKNLFFAHSGGVTSVLNAIAASVIETAKESEEINRVYAGKNGILGLLNEELIDTYQESSADIKSLYVTPSSAFGSCRYKLKEHETEKFARIIEVLKAHNIGHFLYNGGNDSQDTTLKVWQMSQKMGYKLNCIGIPKTVDNDLAGTDTCPGFGSVAKYIALSTKEASFDVASMSATSTKVFILEVMGRHAGWIAAAAGLAAETESDGPHIILFPEIAFDKQKFFDRVRFFEKKFGHCVVVVSEGLKNNKGDIIAASMSSTDAFGHKQLGGVAPLLANMVSTELGLKTHWSVPDYLQRSARHISSTTDFEQACALGKAAVHAALKNESGIMVNIERKSNTPYVWSVGQVKLETVANVEKKLPNDFITEDGMHITEAARTYLEPLILGEEFSPFKKNGLPAYVKLKNITIPQKTKASTLIT
ncbi:MAG: 6-phosphofructokinase [Pseudomonadota bacterium]|nr:6-phosphofructokinase [Pseudomonadota bacterium]